MQQIEINKPSFFQQEFDHLFIDREYPQPVLSVKNMHGCFITFNNIVLKKGLILDMNSIYHYPEQITIFKKKAFEQALHSLIFRKVPFQSVNHPIALINQPWINFYHWMLESLPRLIQIKDYWKSHQILIQPGILSLPFVRETLELFPEVSLYVPEQNINIWAKDLILANLRPFCANYEPEILKKTRDEILSRIEHSKPSYPKKIFITRNSKRKRTIENLQELEELLIQFGFETHDFDNYTLKEQISLVRNSTEIIAIHGAGLSHLMFAEKGTKVLELQKKITNPSDHHSKVYWHLASLLELDYSCFFCEPVDPAESFFTANIFVELTEIKDYLNQPNRDLN